MRVLMLGNSYTSANHLPELLKARTGAEVVCRTRGGSRLAEQLNPKTKLGEGTLRVLSEEEWDYVILQEMSKGPVVSKAAYLKSVSGLCKIIREAGAVPVIFATWAYFPGSPRLASLGMSYGEMNAMLKKTFFDAAAENRAILGDVRAAFEKRHGQGLFAADGSHPSPAGSALAADILAETLFTQG